MPSVSFAMKGQLEMTQLSRTNSQFDRFVFAPLDENGETPLSVLSALARQDIDAWQEAARLAQLPKDRAVTSLASTICKSDSERWSPSDGSVVAARLIELLPSHDDSRDSSFSTDSQSSKLMMWLAYGIIFASIAISGNMNLQSARTSNQPNHTNTVVGQQEAVPQSSRGAGTDQYERPADGGKKQRVEQSR
jgi:hypothetical protein